MRALLPPSLRDERGQMFAGYIIAILVLMLLAIAVVQRTAVVNKDAKNEYYRQQAINVAMAGFEDGVSFFRRQPDGVYLGANVAYAPSSPLRVTAGAWPLWPDSAFNPGPNDTDYYTQLTVTTKSGSTVVYVSASALIRTVALEDYATTSTSSDAKSSRLWGRYVLRRQNTRNWDPYNNTSAAATDPEAVHDLTHILGYNTPGTGNYWSIFSRGYVFTNPTDITIPAAHTNNSLLYAPLRSYLGRPLLRATASVYGEISRLNFDTPNAAVYVATGATLTVNALGIVEGTGGYGVASANGGTASGTGSYYGTIGATLNVGVAPSVGYVFPGQSLATLRAAATHIVYDNTYFPCSSSLSYSAQVSDTTFYYSDTTATTTFASNDCHVLSGVGLAFFRGSIVIQPKNYSSWAGIVYTMGSAVIQGSGNISGLLIAEKGAWVGSSTGNDKAVVEYNNDAVNATQAFLQNFNVITQSIVVTGN
jgi:hypothetical protein